MAKPEEIQFGKVALDMGFLKPTDLASCLKKHKEESSKGIRISFCEWLLQHEYLNTSQIDMIRRQIGHVSAGNNGQAADSPSEIAPDANTQAVTDSTNISSDTNVRAKSAMPIENPQVTPCESPRVTPKADERAVSQEIGNDKPGESKYFGQYQILEELGRGGMGIVYKAQDSRLKRTVALKVLVSGEAAGETEVQRFLREARATAQLQHSNIVGIYDIGEYNSRNYFTMEFIQGTSLKALVQKKYRSVYQIVQIMKKVCDAVHYAHSRGIIHRDLKPANIMLDEHNEPKVMDFGLAKMTRESKKLSQTGMILGTLQYMPPEQAEGKIRAVDMQSDVYALGAILYELLTGVPAITGNTFSKVMYNILHREPTPLKKINPQIPKDLESICLKALEKEKDRRYQNAAALAEELDRVGKGEPVRARPVGFMKRTVRRFGKHKIATILTLLVLSLLSWWSVDWYRRASRAQLAFQMEKEKNYASALALYEDMLQKDPQSEVALKGVLHSAERMANQALLEKNWKTLANIAVRLESLGQKMTTTKQKQEVIYSAENLLKSLESQAARAIWENEWQTFASLEADLRDAYREARKNQHVPQSARDKLNKTINDIGVCEVGEGKLKVISGDQRSKNPFFLFDPLTQQMRRISLDVEERLRPRAYFLFSAAEMGTEKRFYEEFALAIALEKKIELELRTVDVRDETALVTALREAKPGWIIRIFPGIYRTCIVLDESTPYIRIEGDEKQPPVITGPLTLISTLGIKIRRIAVASAEETIVVKDCEDVHFDSLTIGGGQKNGILIERCKGIRVSNCNFAEVGTQGYHQPLLGITCHDCMGVEIGNNNIGSPQWNAIDVVRCKHFFIHHNQLSAPLPYAGECGIKLSDTTMTMVARNRCDNKHRYGILLDGSTDTCALFENVCLNNFYAGIRLGLAGGWISLHRNLVQHNGQAGIAISQLDMHYPPCILKNNVLHDNPIGVKIEQTQSVSMQQNWITSSIQAAISIEIPQQKLLVEAIPKKNPGAKEQPTGEHAIKDAAKKKQRPRRKGPPIIDSDHNIFWENRSLGDMQDGQESNLGDWQAQTGCEMNSVVANPKYYELEKDVFLSDAWPQSPHDLITQPGKEDRIRTFPVPYEIAFAGYAPEQGKSHPASTIRFQPQVEASKRHYDMVSGILYLPLDRHNSADRGEILGSVENNVLVLTSKKDISGIISTFSTPFSAYDSVRTIKFYADAEVLAGDLPERSVAFCLRRAEKQDSWSDWNPVTVAELAQGQYIFQEPFGAALRPLYIQLYWPGEDELREKNLRRAAIVRLKFVEIKIEVVDISWGIFERHEARWVSTLLNGQEIAQRGTFKLKIGEPLHVEIAMRNTGKSIWLSSGGAAVKLRCLTTHLFSQGASVCEIPLQQVVSPPQKISFVKDFFAPYQPGSHVVKWKMSIDHVTVRGRENFGEPATFILEVLPDAQKLRDAREKLEGKWVTGLLYRQIWKIENGKVRPLSNINKYTPSDYDKCEVVDSYLLEGMPQGEMIKKTP